MKKTLLFLICIIGMLTSCSQNDDLTNTGSEDTKTDSQKTHWYGVKSPDLATTRGVADEGKLWNPKNGITIKFLNNPSDPDMIHRIKTIASRWQNYAGIDFKFVETDKKADVRIAFNWQGNDYLTWSYTGTDAKYVRNQTEPTAVLGGLEYLSKEAFRGDVLRVFGQILGLEYEQRHQDWSFWKSEQNIASYWQMMFEGLDLDWGELRDYVFTPLDGENSIYPTQTTEVDELSIMAWPYYARSQTTKLLANYELSEADELFIANLYPKERSNLPTIQEAWVDAGYFEWNDESKTSLRMTYLGAEQETLPDVSDGEQLTSAAWMFSHPGNNIKDYESCTKLKKVPHFNSYNITYFGGMFEGCSSLTSIPPMDTYKGTDFTQMFLECSSITSIPPMDTYKGTNFSFMFVGCTSLTSIPDLDTSNGIDFGFMFVRCSSLISIPDLDTSNGSLFRGMFRGCSSLISIPNLDISKGRSIYCMFEYCSSLTTIPLLNTSKVTDFSAMFSGCSSLTTIPLLDTSSADYFSHMFSGCSSLITIPLLDTSQGTDFSRMFEGCSSLQKKPNLDLSEATSTTDMYYGTPFAN